ncbi:ATP-dependent acyl-CoA ligase [Actinomycetospora sp. NBRC 106375]|uniref:AMP-binding protein n=1 Tax=Actinomycetospora sp. NBRC 106375 TaxID=3032207 RepID=UPI0024A2A324|nr:AMP-binding protein [Actinomycetospora sp. NBRC 106375]GLZ46913.1 ATP-dependent acyl-CoA ligase [Actinomycetospora sp. NBRC 106375]
MPGTDEVADGVITPLAALARRAARDPDAELVRFSDGARIGVGEVAAGARGLAERLAGLVPRGSAVATCLAPGPAAVETIFALAVLGAVEVPVAADLPAPPVRALLATTGASVALVDAHTDPERVAVLREVGPVLVVGDAGGTPARHVLDEPRRPVDRPAPEPGDPLAVMSTSGTTGRAKAAVLPHFAALRQACTVTAAMGYGPGDVLFNVFPWHHINVRHAGLLPALLSGATLVAHPRFTASGFWAICRAEGVTAFNFMGAMLAILERRPPAPDDEVHAVRRAYGAPAPPDLADRFRDRFGVLALEAYACTELADVAISTPRHRRPGTAGRVVPEYEVAIIDDAGRPVPAGEVGQIAARPRAAHVAFLGYAGESPFPAGGWFTTGDRGRVDADGYLAFAGRRADVVRRRGENVAAWDVEEVVRAMPGVVDVAVVGVDAELTEQEVLAAVVADGPGVTAGAVRAWCAGRLPRHAVPRYVRLLAELPRTASGKVRKPALAAEGVTADTGDGEVDPCASST